MKKLVWVLVLAICLAGCGGGGGGGSDDPAPATTNASPAGVWEGTVTDGTNTTFDVTAVVVGNEMRAISNDFTTQYRGTFNVSGDQATGNITGFLIEGYVFPNGSQVATGSLSFSITENQSIQGSYSNVGGDAGTFSLAFSTFNTSASLSEISGAWGYNTGVEWLSLDIDSNGSFTGSDDMGCQYSGNISVPEPEVNAYRLTLTAAQCGEYNGTYNGLATIEHDHPTYGDILWFMLSNNQLSVIDGAFRMNGSGGNQGEL